MAIFGFGQQDPYAEAEQAAQDRQTAFAGMKDNLPALGLIAGLSMLARNNGTRSVGQLIGQAGGDALNAYGTWRKMQDIKDRQAQLDKIAAEEREYARSQDAIRNDMAERKFALDAANIAFQQNMARQRLGLAAASHALAQQNAARAAAAAEAERQGGKFSEKLGGWVMPDGTFRPLQYPEGYTPPGAGGNDEFLPMDAKAKGELYSLGEGDILVSNLIDTLEASRDKGGTGIVIGNLPSTWAGRLDPGGVKLRGDISNFSSQIMNALSGAAVSEQEKKRLEGFLPTTSDDYATLMTKMQGYQDFIRSKANNWQATYGPHARIGKMRVMGGSKKEDPAVPKGFMVVE